MGASLPPSATIWTVGHSNKPAGCLLDLLHSAGIVLLADVRRVPASRRHPQFNAGRLAETLAAAGIDYLHLEDLGGRRTPDPGSPNTAIRDDALRGYADYMGTPPFAAALDGLVGLARSCRTAVMCAEADPAHCHRLFLADALSLRGLEVVHLTDAGPRLHALSPRARLREGRLIYAALL